MTRMHLSQSLVILISLNHAKKHLAICGLSLHLGTTESRKNLEQKFIFQIGALNPHGINERYFSHYHVTTNIVAPTLL